MIQERDDGKTNFHELGQSFDFLFWFYMNSLILVILSLSKVQKIFHLVEQFEIRTVLFDEERV